MIDALFSRVGFSPNDSQRAAIEHLDGPLFLVAGPGSGKTRVLLWRVVNMVAFHGVAPESIFLSTFTEKAAKQLKDGLVSREGKLRVRRSHTVGDQVMNTRNRSVDTPSSCRRK